MANMFQMMKQAMTMQSELKKVQKALAQQTTEYAGKHNLVKVVARGDMTLAGIKIDPVLMSPAEQKKLEELIVAAVNGGLLAAKEKAGKEMAKLTAGMGLPDMG